MLPEADVIKRALLLGRGGMPPKDFDHGTILRGLISMDTRTHAAASAASFFAFSTACSMVPTM